MEDIFSVKNIPWVSEEVINFKDYFEKYSSVVGSVLQQNNGVSKKEDIRKSFPPQPPDDQEDPFDIEKLEAACSPDLLFVKDELLPESILECPARQSSRMSNWYAGKFRDTVIPKEGKECLQTLADQAKEHHLRETVADYGYLRNRQFKYSSIFRMMSDKQDDDGRGECLDEIVINVRVHRPFYRKTTLHKNNNSFPKCIQELLVLGSQKLTDLRDSITCINDLAICEDVSKNPQMNIIPQIPSASNQFPSSFIYINGVFYNDTRMFDPKDYSEGIKTWAQKKKEIGPMVTKKMEDTYLRDIELRLGFPYVFVHLGNCEHVLLFTDARLHHKDDVRDTSRYPITRGQSTKLTTMCQICNLYQANWLTKDEPHLPMEYSLLCDLCLKTFCYDKYGKKVNTLKVYPFMDEYLQQTTKR